QGARLQVRVGGPGVHARRLCRPAPGAADGDQVKSSRDRIGRVAALVLALALLAGCAAQSAYQKAEHEQARENWDQAVLGYSKALALDPGNSRYALALERAKIKASAVHFEKGKRYAAAKQWELAVAEFQQTILLNPGYQHAANELD